MKRKAVVRSARASMLSRRDRPLHPGCMIYSYRGAGGKPARGGGVCKKTWCATDQTGLSFDLPNLF